MNASGTSVMQLTNLSAGADAIIPQWSPKGNKLAFVYWVSSSEASIYLVADDGSGLENITSGFAQAYRPSWSPDGTQLLFIADHDLYSMNMSTRALARITKVGGVLTGIWSPDGNKIAYASHTEDSSFIINADGTHKTPLRCNTELFVAYDMAWSPDGEKVAFSLMNMCSSGTTCGLYVVNIMDNSCNYLAATDYATNIIWQPEQ